jgi:ATP-dependent helicase/nuclease subunit B
MEKFLTKVAKHILAKHGNNLSGITVLMPNHRSCIYFLQALKSCSAKTIWSPEVITLKDWVFNHSHLSLIEPLEQMMVMYEIYKSKEGEETFEEFISTARVMLADFDEVDMQLAEAKPFFNFLERLQSLKVYEPGEEETEYTVRYRKFWKLFRELYFELSEQLLANKKGYTGMIYREVAERLKKDAGFINADDIFYLVGFSTLSKSEETIIQKIKERANLEIIFDTDKYYIEDEYQEAGNFFREQKGKLKYDSKLWQNDFISTRVQNLNIVGVAKNIGQTRVVADILSNKLNLDSESEKETAVIVLDEKLLNPLLSAIPENISALNISMGYPLKESPIAELFRSLFSLHENVERFKTNRKNKLRFYYKDIFDLFHHPYTAYLVSEKRVVSDFLEDIRHYNRMIISDEELKSKFGNGADKLFWYTDDVSEFLKGLADLIEALRVPFLQLTELKEKDMSVDLELLFHVNNTVTNLQNILVHSATGLSVQSLRKLLMEEIRNVRIPFDGEPVRGLQMMGMIETQCLDFKNVIVVSMNEGIFPSGKTQHSYIPYEMRKEFLTTHKEKDAYSAYLFYRLLQRAENVYLLYNTESDEMGGGERSRFILQLQHELNQANPKAVINDLVYSVDPPPPLPDDEIRITKDELLIEKFMKSNAEFGISPSAINTYINCSLQYYFRYIAQLREQEEVEESIEAATLGTAVHYVLENIYADVINKPATSAFVDGLRKNKELIDHLLLKSFSERFDGESLKHGKNYLLYRVCLKLIDEFLKQEKTHLTTLESMGQQMKVLLLEQAMQYHIQVGNYNIKLKGKVDRVEESNGIISIADYKTGTPHGSVIKGDDINLFSTDPKYAKAMQLLTYAWMYWRSTGSPDIKLRSGIYWLRDMSKGLDSLKIDNDDRVTKDVLLQFEDVLRNVLAELLNTEIPFVKTKEIERCAHCEFVKICRRD